MSLLAVWRMNASSPMTKSTSVMLMMEVILRLEKRGFRGLRGIFDLC